jgi:hypothetical protein
MNRIALLTLALSTSFLTSACVITPGGTVRVSDSAELARMSEQALKTCGEGQVKEVSAKSYSCK